MVNEIKTKYEGIIIYYDEFYNKWKCECDLGKKEYPSLREVKEWIDKRLLYLKKKDFKEFDIICRSKYGNSCDLVEGKVTSVSDTGNLNVTFKDRSRRLNVVEYVLPTEGNLKLLDDLNKLKKEKEKAIKAYNKKIIIKVRDIMGTDYEI